MISGADGVQGHVMTLWRLLKQYRIPVFLFVNKMDQEGTDREALLKNSRPGWMNTAWLLKTRVRKARSFWKDWPCAVRMPWKSIWRRGI